MATSTATIVPLLEREAVLLPANSFEHKILDWQNIPDIQDFYENDWLDGESRITLNPSFGNGETRVNADIKITPNFQMIEGVELIHKFVKLGQGETKVLGVSLKEDQIKLHLDSGFRRSWKYHFNPYYKLAFYRNFGVSFRKLSIGLNFGEKDNVTHHELSLLQENDELKIRLRNSYMMTWRFMKYCSIGSNTYGKKIESTQSHVLSIHPHKRLLAYLMINNLVNDETNYNAGAKVDVSDLASLYFNVHVNPYKHYSWMIGSRFDTKKGLQGKLILREFNEASVHLTTDSLFKGKLSFLATVPLSREKVQSPTWGVDLSVDF